VHTTAILIVTICLSHWRSTLKQLIISQYLVHHTTDWSY